MLTDPVIFPEPVPDPRTVLDVLKALDAWLDRPERWTQGTEARNADGNKVMACSDVATQWCLVGAVTPAAPDMKHSFAISTVGLDAVDYLHDFARMLGYNNAFYINDCNSFDFIKNFFIKEAIARLTREQSKVQSKRK